jgi:hypothetical protein
MCSHCLYRWRRGQTRILAMKSSDGRIGSQHSTSQHEGQKTTHVKVIADTDTPYFIKHKRQGDNGPGFVKHEGTLNTLLSVSIAGCDLMGSCLYTAGVCTANAGKVCVSCMLIPNQHLWVICTCTDRSVVSRSCHGDVVLFPQSV